MSHPLFSCWMSLFLIAAQQAPQEALEAFVDPAPPRVNRLEPQAAPVPSAYEGLVFHRAPKPLRADARTEDSPGFLGPHRNGHLGETRLARDWDGAGPPLVWSMERGQGYACPAVAGERVVFAHREADEVHVDCLQAETGKRFWRMTYPTDYRGEYISDSGPRATPLIVGERVYVHGVEGKLLCLELATGRVLWKRDLRADFQLQEEFFGVVSSPLAYAGKLIVNLGKLGGPCVAAFDLETGKLVWGTGTRWGAACSSPVIAPVHGADRLFVLTGGKSRPPHGGLMLMSPDDGRLAFEFPFRSKTFTSVNGATPVIGNDTVFLTAAYSTGTVALALDDEDGYEQLWFDRRTGIEFSTPLYVDGHLYLIEGTYDRPGAILCMDPKSGERLSHTELLWDETVPYEGSEKELSFSIGAGSLVHVDGDFLCLGDNGHLLWLDCKPGGAKVLARASLFRANETWSPPVISRGLLYVCQNKRERFGDAPARLLCYDLRRP